MGFFHIYARGLMTNRLIEYTDGHLWGNIWNAYDQTMNSDGPTISGHPSATGWNLTPHVYATTPSGIAQFIPDGSGSRLWNSYIHTANSLPSANASPASLNGAYLLSGGNQVPTLFATLSSGNLEAFIADHANPPAAWSNYDATSISFRSKLTGDPIAVGGNGQRIYIFGLSP